MPTVVTSDHTTQLFSEESRVVAEVESGETVEFHTIDAHNGTIDMSTVWADVDFPELDETNGNPVTGLVSVRGARVGTTLRVHVLEIRPADRGILPVRSSMGLIREAVPERLCRIVKYEAGQVWINRDIGVPARPMIGTIGVAVSGHGEPTAMPGAHGGNLDNNWISAGTTVDFPVFVDGARIGIGDVHAAMGDAEATCAGVDICSEVVVRVEALDKSPVVQSPVAYRDGYVVTHGIGQDYETAADGAIRNMMAIITDRTEVSEFEALIMIGARGDVRPCQACRCFIPYIVSVAFPVIW